MRRLAPMILALALVVDSIAARECRDLQVPPPVLSYERRPSRVFRDILRAIETTRPGSLDSRTVATRFFDCLDTLPADVEWSDSIRRDGSIVRVGDVTIPLETRDPILRTATRLNRRISSALASAGVAADEYDVSELLWHAWIEAVLSLGHRFDGYAYADDVIVHDGLDRGRVFTVGFALRFEDGDWIVSRLDDPLLAESGVEIGARLVDIDGVPLSGLTDNERRSLWFAPSPFDYRATFDLDGSTVTVDAVAHPRRFRTVDTARIEHIGYLRIHRFANETRIELRRALRDLADSTALILDLRSNGGGTLDVGLIDIFFPPDRVLLTSRPYDSQGETDDRRGSIEYDDRPLAVLIDADTASMSETLAAAIRQNDRGVLIGETTFGKGVSQTRIAIRDDGRLTLVDTIYFFPGTTDTWNEVGIRPHHEISITEDERERVSALLDESGATVDPTDDRVLADAIDTLREYAP